MLRFVLSITAAAALTASVAAAQAQPGPANSSPSPGEQAGMHQGVPGTLGSSSVVHDENGVHLDGYPHMAVVKTASGRLEPIRKEHDRTNPSAG